MMTMMMMMIRMARHRFDEVHDADQRRSSNNAHHHCG